MNKDPKNIKGTDINYYFICRRRAWMSLKNFYIIDNNQFVTDGNYLSERNRRYGYSKLRIGRNEIDNLELTSNGGYIVHEFKRGRKTLNGDRYQVLHYMNLLNSKGLKIDSGAIHLLGSKKVERIELNDNSTRELLSVYAELYKLENEPIPEPVRNYYCKHGCSYSTFCWG